MYYVNLRHIEQQSLHITKESLLSMLIIPKEQRSGRDHEIVYKFFYHNPFLSEIERTKSLNARLNCVSELQVKDRKQDEEQYQLISKFKIQKKEEQTVQYEHYYVVLLRETLEKIKSKKQGYLRNNMEVLKKFSILQEMKYEQLLHLATYMQTCSYKYKQYVFHEGQQSTFMYLVIEGQFHYIKQVQQKNQQEVSKKKKKKPQRYNLTQVNPNKLRKSRSKELKVGIIEGGLGQVMGEEELLTRQHRKYTLQCMSTENQVVKIHRDYYLNVLKGSQTRMRWMLSQNKKKMDFKKESLARIVETKKNYKKYFEAIQEEEERKRLKGSQSLFLQNNNESMELKEQSSQLQHQSIRTSNKSLQAKKMLIKNMSKGKLNEKTSKRSQKTEKSQKKQEIRYENEDDEEENEGEGATFSLTHAITQNQKKTKVQKKKSIAKSVHITQSSKHESFLPEISHHQKSDMHEQKVAKSWSVSRPIVQLKGLRSKYSGMIDSNALIREKEYILAKKTPKDIRSDIFPVETPKRKNPQLFQFDKVKLGKDQVREMRSAVHSKDYMQRLLIDALKRAGYEKRQQEQSSQKVNSKTIELKKGRRRQKLKYQTNKLKQSQSLLEDNPFDQYYFKQI